MKKKTPRKKAVTSKKISPWMEGVIVAEFRSGVRVYDLGYCVARCGCDRPAKCPKSDACHRYQVYVVRWNYDGSFDWRQAACGLARQAAFEMAAKRAETEEHFAVHDKTLMGFVEKANADGRI